MPRFRVRRCSNSSRAQSSLLPIGFRVEQPGPEALNQIISERGHQPRPYSLDTNSFRAQQHCRLDSPIGIFTLEMSEPVCETTKRVRIPLGSLNS
jgi:hypothetical protein